MKKIIAGLFVVLVSLALFACAKGPFEVSFDTGEAEVLVAPQTIDKNGLVTEPTDVEFLGRELVGWFTAATGGTEWKFEEDKVTKDMTLYARWQLDSDVTPVTLTYAGHDLGTVEDNNIERQMIAAFTSKFPHITVNILERPKVDDPNNPGQQKDQDWVEFLTAKAAANTFPDLFNWFSSGADAASRGWAYDLKDIVAKDLTFNSLPEPIRNAGIYNGRQFGVVTRQFYWGYLINKSLLNDYIGETPTYGIEFTDLLDMAETSYTAALAADPETDYAGINGVKNDLWNWLPAQYQTTLGYSTFDPKDGFHWNSDGFKQAMEKTIEIGSEPWVKDFTDFNNGNVGIHYMNSAELSGIIANTKNENHKLYQTEIDYIGIPSVNGVNRVPTIIDVSIVSKGTQHPEEAYQLLKWMSYGLDGYKKRLDLSTAVSFPPMIDYDDNRLTTAYLANFAGLTEYGKFLSQQTEFIPEQSKATAGYGAGRWDAVYGEISSRPGQQAKVGDMIWDTAFGALPGWKDMLAEAQKVSNEGWKAAAATIDAQIALHYGS